MGNVGFITIMRNVCAIGFGISTLEQAKKIILTYFAYSSSSLLKYSKNSALFLEFIFSKCSAMIGSWKCFSACARIEAAVAISS